MKALPSLLNGLFWVAVYLGVGALCHVHFIGQVFLVDNMNSWGTLLAWPVVLMLAALKWIMIVVGALLTLVLVWCLLWWLTPLNRWVEAWTAANLRKAVQRSRDNMDKGGF